MDHGLTAYQLQQLREALDQGGLGGGGKLAGGLVVGSVADGPGAGVGDVRISGSVRESLALGAGAYREGMQLIPNATYTAISFSGARFDTDRCWDAARPTRLTAHTGGVYVVSGTLVWDYYGAGYRYVLIQINGGRYIATVSVTHFALGPYMNIAAVVWLNEGDYLELCVLQSCGEDLNIYYSAGYVFPEFSMVRVA
jgi:hypothetical protein